MCSLSPRARLFLDPPGSPHRGRSARPPAQLARHTAILLGTLAVRAAPIGRVILLHCRWRRPRSPPISPPSLESRRICYATVQWSAIRRRPRAALLAPVAAVVLSLIASCSSGGDTAGSSLASSSPAELPLFPSLFSLPITLSFWFSRSLSL
ncbi:hypothetical protein Scep_003680 [Stephania cephalantha]|uniref:Uncharacterized protein n=1 Tax=Stephania cephalantha TaxID=152367 RepID=A0AAP0PYA2_9MAGN